MATDFRVSRIEPTRERALVAAARSDPAAFGELYDFYLPGIYGYIARRIADRTVAEELTAKTFERALSVVRSDALGDAPFSGFLHRVAASAVIDQARREARSIPPGVRASDLDEDGDREAAETMSDEQATRVFSAAMDRDVLRRALQELPEPHRRVILLKYFDGLDPDELAAAFGSTRSAFALKLHRALWAMRAAMSREAFDAA
jgi:RNA polymerase sigma-70 factor, ECF subfamily